MLYYVKQYEEESICNWYYHVCNDLNYKIISYLTYKVNSVNTKDQKCFFYPFSQKKNKKQSKHHMYPKIVLIHTLTNPTKKTSHSYFNGKIKELGLSEYGDTKSKLFFISAASVQHKIDINLVL